MNIVAISETWLDEEKEVDMTLEGYKQFTVNRVKKVEVLQFMLIQL